MMVAVFLWLVLLKTVNLVQTTDIEIDGSLIVGDLPPFWSSTGFCPPLPHENVSQFVRSEDMKQNIALIGALPSFGQRRQVRVHWLLDLIEVKKDNANSSEPVTFNFEHLDFFLDLLHLNGLKPGFEVMGNPSNHFSDFTNETQLELWTQMVVNLVERYIERYGEEYVMTWNFETWNEPDHRDFDSINFTREGFLNYYEATRRGLDSVSSKLTFGGPGERCLPVKNDSICWALIDKLMNSDLPTFLSFHEKGESNDTSAIIKKELEILDELEKRFPNYTKTIDFVNNEGDPAKIWSEARDWQSDATYAGLVARVVAEHVERFFSNQSRESRISLKLLSNDNGFLSNYPNQFSSRTLLARLQINDTTPNYVTFIRKPVYGATGLLGFLGHNLIDYQYLNKEEDDAIKVVPTQSTRKNYAILVVNSLSTVGDQEKIARNVSIALKLRNSSAGHNWKWIKYSINNEQTNPVALWKKAGSPAYPSKRLFKRLRGVEGPRVFGPLEALMSCDKNYHCSWSVNWTIQSPGVELIVLCREDTVAPGKVMGLQVIKVNEQEALLVWKNVDTRCVKSYEVQFSQELSPTTTFRQINWWPLIFASFNYRSNKLPGFFRVRAVDLFDRKGEFSDIVEF